MEHSGNIPTFSIPRTFPREYSYIQYSWNMPQGIFPGISRERFPNIPGIYHGNVPRIFQEHIFCLVGSDIENFDPNSIKVDEKSYKNILIYYIGYVTKKIIV